MNKLITVIKWRLINLTRWIWGWRQRRLDEASMRLAADRTAIFRSCVQVIFERVRLDVAKELSPEEKKNLDIIYLRLLSKAEACFNNVDFQDLTKNAREKRKKNITV